MDLATLIVTTMLTLVGLWATNSLRRQQRLRIEERRLEDYRGLWQLMEIARVTRGDNEDPHSAGPLAPKEALDLYDELTSWYFSKGGGLVLPDETKHLYLEVMRRLVRYGAGKTPGSSEEASDRCIRDLSVLRTQLKNDVGVYGRSYFNHGNVELGDGDKALLLTAGISRPDGLDGGAR